MMQIRCPWCGPRNATEFHHHGPSSSRPQVSTATPEQWRRYLYVHENPFGEVTETWYHGSGCRRFFQLVRDTFKNVQTQPAATETAPTPREGDQQ